ncbi:MAG: putative amidohydrolase YtcJ [Planctomycetota bacterium]|jgi:predicted amidohydrolase YtcJ
MLSTILSLLSLLGFLPESGVPAAPITLQSPGSIEQGQASGETAGQELPGAVTESAVSPMPIGNVLAPPEPSVETLFIYGGLIYLGNIDQGAVEALLVEDGRVIAAGTEKRLRVRLPEVGVNMVDLKGAIAVPGIQDSHAHVERIGESLEELDLRGIASYAELIEKVKAAAEGLDKGEWIVGNGWDQRLWDGGELPDHADLSEATPDNPVLLWRIDGHTSLANYKALMLAGLHEEIGSLRRIQGGRILVDEESHATGVLIDQASKLVSTLFVPLTDEEREAHILASQEQLLARGITCVHDMGASASTIDLYESLRERGLLKVRIVAYLDGNVGLSSEALERFPLRSDSLDQLSVPGVVFRVDGDLGTHSAALLADYSDAPGEQGHLLLTEERLTLLVHEAWQAGLQPAIQAVGDRANRIALDTFERMSQVDENFALLRPRVEHAQVISSRDIPRFPQLRVTPSMQPPQILMDPTWNEARLGSNRSRGTYAWRSLAPGLLQLAFGSNLPFDDAGPLGGIYAARIRRNHETIYATDNTIGTERLDGFGALAGYTRGPAHAVHQEGRRGQLIPGYWADLTVFDTDPVEGDTETLLDARVLLTVVNGRIVYQR